MKYLITALLFLMFCTTAKATHCVDTVYQKAKITLYLCQNGSEFNETRALLYEARTKVLNDYIQEKIDKGELKEKKFEIRINGITPGYLILTIEENCYYVYLSGYPTLQELIVVVDYFSKPDWKPFWASVDDENAQKRIDDFYVQNTKSEMVSYKPFVIWKKDSINLEYAGDSLRYLINDIPLPFLITSSLPVKIHDRYLFFQRDGIFVMQDMQIIQSFEIDKSWKDTSEDFGIYVCSKEVVICFCWATTKDRWMYRYSYDENRFYQRKR